MFRSINNSFTSRSIKGYHEIWKDLRTLSMKWKRVLLPSFSMLDMGVNEAIYSSLNREIIFEHPSPIITMRAQKNSAERDGMRAAHVSDAVALIDTLSYFEERVRLRIAAWIDENNSISFPDSTFRGTSGLKNFWHLKRIGLVTNSRKTRDSRSRRSLPSVQMLQSRITLRHSTTALKSRTRTSSCSILVDNTSTARRVSLELSISENQRGK